LAPGLESQSIDYIRLLLDLYDRKPELALTRLKEGAVDVFSLQDVYAPRGLFECICLTMMGERQRANVACSSAVAHLQREIGGRPHDYRLFISLGHALAILGRSEEAGRAGEHAAELRPIPGDVLDGVVVAIELAKIYTRVGETDKALHLIEELLSIPCELSVGLLRLDPVWDPLRDLPRFQALLEKYDTN
jgi:serine/threonine-protein kinase